jgi:hypothetical protein
LQQYVDVPINSTLFARERLLGDYNGDFVVDAADYTIWRNAEGLTGVELPADGAGANGLPDGVVDQLDYWCWKTNFGQSVDLEGAASHAQATVPEPACLSLYAAWGGAVYCGCVRRRALRRSRIGLEKYVPM